MRFSFSIFLLIVLSFSVNKNALRGDNRYEPAEFLTDKEWLKIMQILEPERIETIQSTLEKYFTKSGFQGNVLIGHKGQPLFKGSYGYSDQKEKTPLTDSTIFQLASVSKQFTAMGIMLLQEEGLLDYDDPVQLFFPNFPYDNVTIRHLLNHTAGLPNYMWLLEKKWTGKTTPTNDEAIALMEKHKPSRFFLPGRKFHYSNTAYMVLASIIEKASGQKYADYLEDRIFRPLGMKNTFAFSVSTDTLPENAVMGWQRAGRGYKKIDFTVNDGTVGDKNIFSTTEDLYIWERALFTDKLVSPQTLAEAQIPGKINQKRFNQIPYGFGFRLRNTDSKKVVYHNGLWNGFRNSFVRYVEDTTTIILLSHINYPGKAQLSKQLEKIAIQPTKSPITLAVLRQLFEEGNATATGYLRKQDPKDLERENTIALLKQTAAMLYSIDKQVSASRIETLLENLQKENPALAAKIQESGFIPQ